MATKPSKKGSTHHSFSLWRLLLVAIGFSLLRLFVEEHHFEILRRHDRDGQDDSSTSWRQGEPQKKGSAQEHVLRLWEKSLNATQEIINTYAANVRCDKKEQVRFFNPLFFADDDYEGPFNATPKVAKGSDPYNFCYLKPARLMSSQRYADLHPSWTCLDDAEASHNQLIGIPKIPHGIVLGVQKGGTDTLYKSMLVLHSQVVPTSKELHFWDRDEPGWFNKQEQTNNQTYLRVDAIRKAYVETLMQSATQKQQELAANSSITTMSQRQHRSNATHFVDISPSYFLFSKRISRYISCVLPWVKLVVLLRNPVERAFSHYTMSTTAQKERNEETYTVPVPLPSVEAFIAQDVQVLWQTGVLQAAADAATANYHDTLTQDRLDMAWQRYTSATNSFVVGRGLYAIQLRHWFQELDQSRQKSRNDLLVLSSHDFLHDRDAVYGRILKHLGLEWEPPSPENAHVQTYHEPLPERLQTLLQDLYRPFDLELKALLASRTEGWKGWDYDSKPWEEPREAKLNGKRPSSIAV